MQENENQNINENKSKCSQRHFLTLFSYVVCLANKHFLLCRAKRWKVRASNSFSQLYCVLYRYYEKINQLNMCTCWCRHFPPPAAIGEVHFYICSCVSLCVSACVLYVGVRGKWMRSDFFFVFFLLY